MRKFFCLLVICFASLYTTAQEVRDLKQVKLKSGISITGYVINNADGSISVTTIDGDQLWYSSNEILSVSEDPAIVEARRIAEEKAKEDAEAEKRARKDAIQMKDKGFQFILESGLYLAANSQYMDDPIIGGKLYIIPSCRLNKHIIMGVGIGFTTLGWDIEYKEPLYKDDVKYTIRDTEKNGAKYKYEYCFGYGPTILARIAYNFMTTRVTPYCGLDLGYCLMNMEILGTEYRYDYYDNWRLYSQGMMETADNRDAFFLEGNVGCMFRTRKGSGLNIGLSLTYSPAPSSAYDLTMYDSVQFGLLAGWTF